MENSRYVFIGYQEEYTKENIEPYFIEIRDKNEDSSNESKEPLEWFFTKEEAIKGANRLATKENIPFDSYIHQW